MMKGRIELLGMHFFSRHGCLEKERLHGNEFKVDFSCDWDTSAAELSDELEDTLDYSLVYNIIAREMARPSKLLEHVAGRIADALKQEVPGMEHFEISVYKKNPPVRGECEWAKISIRR